MELEFVERALTLACGDDTLVGVIARPREPLRRGVLVVVGGPQYRAGSHRQFVLLARFLASHGIACMRFDYRGMGDSSGRPRTFEEVGVDIGTAVDGFFAEVPHLREVCLWGLCDAASAATFYAPTDVRVTGLVLLNPWVRTTEGQAKAYVKHYYLHRMADAGFWRKALSGQLDLAGSLHSLLANLKDAAGRATSGNMDVRGQTEPESLPDRMASALERFDGRLLLILSGKDLTAREFSDLSQTSARWQRLLGADSVTRIEMGAANHTFSTRQWRDQVAEHTRSWVLAA
jgi:exosortase A-associated hydrolase 1